MGYSSFPTILQNGVEAEEGSQNTSWSGIHSGQDTILSQNLRSRGREAPAQSGSVHVGAGPGELVDRRPDTSRAFPLLLTPAQVPPYSIHDT